MSYFVGFYLNNYIHFSLIFFSILCVNFNSVSILGLVLAERADERRREETRMEFFEGTEKLLEIWFTKSHGKCTDKNDLRDIPRECLDYILDMVNCKILSCTRSRDLDAYVLSESSLFINKSRLLIKTCGTTTLLYSVRPFIEAAFKFSGFDSIQVRSLLLLPPPPPPL